MNNLAIVLFVLVLPCADLRERTQRDRFPPRPVVQPSTETPVTTEGSVASTSCKSSERVTTEQHQVKTTQMRIEGTSGTIPVERISTTVVWQTRSGITTEESLTVGTREEAIVITSTLMPNPVVVTTERDTTPKLYNTGMSTGSIVGITLGTAMFLMLIMTASCYCYCSRRRGGYRLRTGIPGFGEFDGRFTPAVALDVSDYLADDDELITSFRQVPDADRWGGKHASVGSSGCDIEME
jgi:hypothetical protein